MIDCGHLTFVWFSWGPDGRCLRESVASVKAAAPGAALIVVEDGAALIADDVRAGMPEALWIQSEWDRRGNLNGLEHLNHQLRIFAAVGKPVVKMDSDMLLLDAGWLGSHDFSREGVASVTQPAWWFQGCYGLSPLAVEWARRLLPMAAEICPHQGPRWPEDQVTGELLASPAAFDGVPGIHHYHGWPVGKAVAHYDYAANAPFEAYRGFWTVNFGGRAGIKAPESLRRGLAADTMRAFREWHAGQA